jgi:hypothetical protein
MTTTTMDVDPEFIRLYEQAEFERMYRDRIETALARIDRARKQLVSAQNNLVWELEGSNDHTRAIFSGYYAAGGVTAADWREWRGRPARTRTGKGQLRVVGGTTRGATPRRRLGSKGPRILPPRAQ